MNMYKFKFCVFPSMCCISYFTLCLVFSIGTIIFFRNLFSKCLVNYYTIKARVHKLKTNAKTKENFIDDVKFNATLTNHNTIFNLQVQTVLHVAALSYGYLMNMCSVSPNEPSLVLFYLTYLYNKKCGDIHVKPPKLFSLEGLLVKIIGGSVMNEEVLYNSTQIVQEILDRADMPDNSLPSGRTLNYMMVFMILNCVWIVTAVALLMGTCFRLKETHAVIFYGPWLVATALMLLLDLAASVHFGFDIENTNNFASWLTFVGIKNPADLADLDEKTPHWYLSKIPTLLTLSFSTRFLFFWLFNLIGLVCVLKATTSVYKEKFQTGRHTSGPSSNSSASTVDLNSSEARIRNWQNFYGPIESSTPSTTASDSDKGVRIVISPSTPLESQNNNTFSPDALAVIPEDAATTYHQYPDVAENIEATSPSTAYRKELKSHLPFSYFDKNQDVDIGSKTRLKMAIRPNSLDLELISPRTDRTFTLRSTSSDSSTGTEL